MQEQIEQAQSNYETAKLQYQNGEIDAGEFKQQELLIALDGRDTLRMNREYRKHLGYMPQQNGYFDAFSVRMFWAYMAESKGLKRKRG